MFFKEKRVCGWNKKKYYKIKYLVTVESLLDIIL